MGSDLHMNPPRDERTVSQMVRDLERDRDDLRQRMSAVIAEKSRLEAQARQDEQTIVRLTRERDAAMTTIVEMAADASG